MRQSEIDTFSFPEVHSLKLVIMKILQSLVMFSAALAWVGIVQAQGVYAQSINVAVTRVSFELDNTCSRPGIDCARITYSPHNLSTQVVRIIDLQGEMEIPNLRITIPLGPLTSRGIRPQVTALLGSFKAQNHQAQEQRAELIRGLYNFDQGEPTFFLNPGETVESRPCCGLAARFGSLAAVEVSEVAAGQNAIFRFRLLDEFGNRLNPSDELWDAELSLTLPQNQK